MKYTQFDKWELSRKLYTPTLGQIQSDQNMLTLFRNKNLWLPLNERYFTA